MRRISWFVGLAVGILLLAAAPVVRWVVAPAVTVLPSDTNTLRVYTGTASVVINPTVTHGTLFGPGLLRDQPVTVQHGVTVTDTSGNNAKVVEKKLVTIPGATVAAVTHSYAVDRKTMGRGTGFSGVTAQTGITFNWPIHTKKHNYAGWVSDTQSTTPLVYSGVATRGGVKTLVFKANVPSARITDPAELKGMPATMTKETLNTLTPSLGLTIDQLKRLSTTLSKLPDPVPFGYLFKATTTFWVAPDSGLVVDVASHEVRTSGFLVGDAVAPVGPVLDFSYSAPPSTLQAAASDAKNKADQMQLISATIPLVALITGGVLILVLLASAAVSRRRVTPTATPTGPPSVAGPPRELTPVG